MSVNIGHATSEVIAEPEPVGTGERSEPQQWEQAARLKMAHAQLARDAGRTHAEGFDD